MQHELSPHPEAKQPGSRRGVHPVEHRCGFQTRVPEPADQTSDNADPKSASPPRPWPATTQTSEHAPSPEKPAPPATKDKTAPQPPATNSGSCTRPIPSQSSLEKDSFGKRTPNSTTPL